MQRSFLDKLVKRSGDDQIILDCYQQRSSSGRYIHYRSYYQWSFEVNVVLGMKHSIKRIIHLSRLPAALNRLGNILIECGYTIAQQGPLKLHITVSLPYIKDLTPSLETVIRMDNINSSKYCVNKGCRHWTPLKDKFSDFILF